MISWDFLSDFELWKKFNVSYSLNLIGNTPYKQETILCDKERNQCQFHRDNVSVFHESNKFLFKKKPKG